MDRTQLASQFTFVIMQSKARSSHRGLHSDAVSRALLEYAIRATIGTPVAEGQEKQPEYQTAQENFIRSIHG